MARQCRECPKCKLFTVVFWVSASTTTALYRCVSTERMRSPHPDIKIRMCGHVFEAPFPPPESKRFHIELREAA